VDLGEGPGDPPPPFLGEKKEEMTEGKKASRASKTKPSPPPSPLSSKSGSTTENDPFLRSRTNLVCR